MRARSFRRGPRPIIAQHNITLVWTYTLERPKPNPNAETRRPKQYLAPSESMIAKIILGCISAKNGPDSDLELMYNLSIAFEDRVLWTPCIEA